MTTGEFMLRLLNRSAGIDHSVHLRRAVALALALSASALSLTPLHAQETSTAATKSDKAKKDEDVASLSDVSVNADALRAISNDPSASSFGFAKPLLETPRSVQFVSEEQLSKFGVQSVQDLTRLVPGTYTTTRYGLQGAINVRSVTADQYYRGMKRLDQQGHVRTVLSAYDNIEVVKGPPSPVYGMGRIGGYTVLDPKASRAKTGKYMTKDQGYFQALTGSYRLSEFQFGEGLPFTIADRAAGVYLVGLLENSEGWIKNVGAQQKFLQATASVDRAIGPFRFETGGQLQNSITSGSYMNRGTQDLVDHGTYIGGQPMVNLDLNSDGRVGYVETYMASPVSGALSGSNQALTQRFTWKTDASGNPIPLSQFKDSIDGIPLTFKNYLTAHPEISCSLANYMRTLPTSTLGTATSGSLMTRNLPVGFFINPCTVNKQQVDYRANGSFERQQNAVQRLGYADLIYDTDPNFTVKQQFFYDSIDSFKDSWLPYGERQYIKAFEDKITVTKRLPEQLLPNWLGVNTLASINYRDTRGYIRSSGGDFDYRQDVMAQSCPDFKCEGSGTGGHYPNTMFWTQLTNNSYGTGAPTTSETNSQYDELGLGVMADIEIFRATNLVIGGRYDKVDAHVDTPVVQNPSAGAFTPDASIIAQYVGGTACTYQGQIVTGTGTPQTCPGGVARAQIADSSQNATSWSASISHELPWGRMRPYYTQAVSSLALDGANSLFSAATVAGTNPFITGDDGINRASGGKIIGQAKLQEVGIKGQLFDGRAQWTFDTFKQTRNDVSSPTDPSVGVEVTSTETKGVEADVKFVPIKKIFLSASAAYMKSEYITGASASNMEVSGRDLGFKDIVDPTTGAVYPAEAFLYGGRTALILTDPNNIYKDVPGLPAWQGAFNATYELPRGFGASFSSQYFSQTWANRIKTVKLPQALLFDAGVTFDHRNLHLRFSEFNIADTRYFQQGQSTNANLLTVMPGRRWQFQLKVDF
jgi:iron complex outermembrane recepter protein